MKSGFDRLAKLYRWLEYVSFGRALERCRFSLLQTIVATRNALVLGDGDGRFAARLLQTAPMARLHAVDESTAMLDQLEVRCAMEKARGRLVVHHADLTGGLPQGIQAERFDLVATHFFLDCLSTKQVSELVACVRPLLTGNARWLVSEFDVPAGILRLPAAALVKTLYLSFRLLTGLRISRLPRYRDVLAAQGFACQQQIKLLGGLLVAELWSIHRDSTA